MEVSKISPCAAVPDFNKDVEATVSGVSKAERLHLTNSERNSASPEVDERTYYVNDDGLI